MVAMILQARPTSLMSPELVGGTLGGALLVDDDWVSVVCAIGIISSSLPTRSSRRIAFTVSR
jgi:hypothetical protein